MARKITPPRKPIRPYLRSLTPQERREVLQPGEEKAPNLAEIMARLGKRSLGIRGRSKKRKPASGVVSAEWRRESVEEEAQVYARPLDPSVLQQMPVSSKTFYERGFLERLKENVMEVLKRG